MDFGPTMRLTASQTVNERPCLLKGRPPTVAIVDDNASMLRSIQRLLTIEGFAVETFTSAEAFLARRPDGEAACVVLDIQLPGMSGIELRQHLKVLDPDLPIIFITAISDERLRQAAAQLGCAAYLNKPFAPDLLVGAVARALGGRP